MRTIITAFVMKGAGVLKLNLFACCIALPFTIEQNYLLICVSDIVNLPDSLVFQLCVKIVQAGLSLRGFFFLVILFSHNSKIYTTFLICAVIFGLT